MILSLFIFHLYLREKFKIHLEELPTKYRIFYHLSLVFRNTKSICLLFSTCDQAEIFSLRGIALYLIPIVSDNCGGEETGR